MSKWGPLDILIVVGHPEGPDETTLVDASVLEEVIKQIIDQGDVEATDISVWELSRVRVRTNEVVVDGIESLYKRENDG